MAGASSRVANFKVACDIERMVRQTSGGSLGMKTAREEEKRCEKNKTFAAYGTSGARV
jgi:hypothetical protein